MSNWLDAIPEDCASMIWKWVYGSCLQELQYIALHAFQSRSEDYLLMRNGNVCVPEWVLVNMVVTEDDVALLNMPYFYSKFGIGILPKTDLECKLEICLGEKKRQTMQLKSNLYINDICDCAL